MGSKRVGLARTQALFEGLKRSLTMDGTTFSSTSWSTSDDRVKNNEQSIDGALDTIDKLEPKHYIKTQKMYDASHNFTLNSSGNPVKDNGELLTDYPADEDKEETENTEKAG